MTQTLEASDLDVSEASIKAMKALGSAFYVDDSWLRGTELVISDNDLEDAYKEEISGNFNGIVAVDYSSVTVQNVTFKNNTGVDVSL